MRFRSNLDKFIKGFKRVIKEEMRYTAAMLPGKIAEACPYPSLKTHFISEYEQTSDGAVFRIKTDKPMIAVYVTEFGRRGLPRRGATRFPAGGYPLKVKKIIKRKRGVITTSYSRREKEKFEKEGVVIRPGPIKAVPPRPFIRPTWNEEYHNLRQRISERILKLINRVRID